MSDKDPEEEALVSIGDMDFVIVHSYPLQDALADGLLVPFMPTLWLQMSGGQPIVVTKAVSETLSNTQLLEIWLDYLYWRKHTMPTLAEEDQMYVTEQTGEKVWVIDDETAYTILFPEDY